MWDKKTSVMKKRSSISFLFFNNLQAVLVLATFFFAGMLKTYGQCSANPGPAIWQSPPCGSSTITLYMEYYGPRSGDYYIEFYVASVGDDGEPEFSVPVYLDENSTTYLYPYEHGDVFWVGVYDPATSPDCRTQRTRLEVTRGTSPQVWGTGSSCESGSAHIQAEGTSNISSYNLYRYDGFTYDHIEWNTSGSFTIEGFDSDDPQYVSNYYITGTTSTGCQTQGFTHVNIDVLRPTIPPLVTGNFNPCYNMSTTVTASGGLEGYYRWYDGGNNLLPETGAMLHLDNVTTSTNYYVSYVQTGGGGAQCESPKRQFNVDIVPAASVSGFTVSPGTQFYVDDDPEITPTHVSSVGTVTYEYSTDGVTWSEVPGSITVYESTQFRAKAINQDCPSAYSSPILVSIYPLPVITAIGGVNYLSFGKTVTVSTGTYHSYQWMRDGQNIIGANGQNLAVTEPGVYTVKVKGSSIAAEVISPGFQVYGDPLKAQNLNYISTITFLDKEMDPSALHMINPELYSQSTTYFDGIGRPMQTVITRGSTQGFDVVLPVAYDEFGRESVKYLPYASDERNGQYKENALMDPSRGSGDPLYAYRGGKQYEFYQTGSKITHDQFPYAQTVFDPSPLNRVVEQGAPGSVWQPGMTNTIKKFYQTNSANEVQLWTYARPNTDHPLGIIDSQGPYEPHELYKNITTDENGADVIEYTDKEGRTVLKRSQVVNDLPGTGDPPPINDTNYASTYYIYDDWGNLVCVVQPEGVRNISSYLSSTSVNREAFLQKWAFRYRYDHRKRIILRQVPGADSVIMVYDIRDRLVLTQDGNQRNENKWLFTKYDRFNRPVMTGVYSHGNSITQKAMTALLSTTNLSETFDGNATNHGYTNSIFPNSSIEVLTVAYYDNYNFKELVEFDDDFDYQGNQLPTDGGQPGQDGNHFNRIKTLVTGAKTRVLNTQTWLCTVNYYDDKYRVIQTTSHNHKDGFTRATSVYDFAGKILRTKTFYSIPGHPQHAQTSILQRYSYDHGERLRKTYHRLNSSDEVLLSENEYNELGQLVTKKLHKIWQSGTYVTADPLVGQPGVVYGDVIEAPPYNNETAFIAKTRIKLKRGFSIPVGQPFRGRIDTRRPMLKHTTTALLSSLPK
jgi:hypothetical protein